MGTVHELRRRRVIGDVTWRAAILLGIGDDDMISVVAESEHTGEQAARAWIEQQLPGAGFPAWVIRRRHGTAGAFLYGQVERGHYAGHTKHDWEPGLADHRWDADLVDGVLRWRKRG